MKASLKIKKKIIPHDEQEKEIKKNKINKYIKYKLKNIITLFLL